MLDRQCGELIALTEEEQIGGSAPAWTWSKPCKGCIEVAFGACMDDMSVQPKRPGGHIGAFSGAAMLVHDVWSIGHQPTRFDILPKPCIVGSRALGAKVLTRMRFVFRSGSAATLKCIRTALERSEGGRDVLGAPPQFV
jgi:hypothetical protein